ncbi:hypothetical protein [Pontibacter pamirensis]|uniref:hypothetical protein n=1 Tax=Pontibacter pamirensis TaxID=2562824 RepID=UPI001389DE16|nr:hypothetical protein [Pontibacter pamirensis]
MEITATSTQHSAQELSAEKAISHLLGVEEDHIEQLDDYLVELHTSYLTNEQGMSRSYRENCNYYFNQMHGLLKNLKKIERQRDAQKAQSQSSNAA